jgi:hypothetical protein
MKKSDLVKIIKEAVREEVRAVLKEELGGKRTSTPSEFTNVMSHAEELFKPKTATKFTKDPVLNEVLNETANDWPTMGGKTLGANDALAGKAGLAAAMGMESMEQTFGGQPTPQAMAPDDRKHIEVPKEVGKALTRDYSDLMKRNNIRTSNR